MKIALGTAQFGMTYGVANRRGQIPAPEAEQILRWSRLAGIDTIDTAMSYGESEACLGRAGMAGFKVVTKLPLVPAHCTDVVAWAKGQVHDSLQRLGIPRLHGLFLHHAKQLSGEHGAALATALRALKDEGSVQKVGVSVYSPTDLQSAESVCTLDLVQAPFNLLDRRLLESGWLEKLSGQGVEVHIRSAFLQGLLLMSSSEIPKRFSPWTHVLGVWHQWLIDHPNITAAQACLAYVSNFPQINKVVVGVDDLTQLKQLVSASGLPFNAEFPDLSCTDEMLINPSNWN